MAEKRAEKPKFSCPSGVQILEKPLKTPNRRTQAFDRRTQAFDRRTQAFNRRTQSPFACVTCSPTLSLEGTPSVQATVLRLMDLRLLMLRVLRLLILRHPLQVWILRHPTRHLILQVLILLRPILTCPPLLRILIQCVQ